MKNYYVILGVHRAASSVEIKRAYRRLAVSLHPDKNPDPEAEQLFKEINEAYEIIGDPEKRKTYDSWLDNPSEKPEAEIRPPHRDPAYHRKRSAGRQAPGKSTTRDLIAEYVAYFKWATYAGFVLTFLLAIDYVLPDQTTDDQIDNIYTVSKSTARYGRSMVYAYDIIETKTGKSIRVYDHKADHFETQDSLKIFSTIIFSEPMRIHSLKNNQVTDLGYLYHTGIGWVPLALFILTGLALVLRHRIEFLFNASIVSIVLIVIVLYLIFTI